MNRKRANQGSGFTQGIKKFLLSAFVVITFLAYFFHERFTTQASASANNPNSNNAQVPIPTAGNVSVPSQGVVYKNGTYTGPQTDAFYGQVQVQVVIQNGKIANVIFLDYPSDRRTSQQINSQVMPWLTQEAIQADSANVDLISGATLTSQAFVNSLQSALLAAKN